VFTDSEINEATFMALQQVISGHTVILINKRREVGTGTLVTVGTENVILTAYHNMSGSGH